MFYFRYALKSVFQRRKQYTSLFAVCSVSVCIILCLIGICDGMLKSLNNKAVQYYGGELQFISGDKFQLDSPDEKIQIITKHLNEMGIKNYCSKRFDYDGVNTQFYYEGAETFCRILKGIDFKQESELLKNFTLVSGGVENAGTGNILISQPVAEKLGCKAGDNITVMMNTIYGYTNTMQMTVAAVFQDSSLFGMYTSYISLDSLREITGYPSNYVNRIGIYTPGITLSKKQVSLLQEKLSNDFFMAPIPERKDVFINESWTKYDKPVYALITLDANRPEVVMMQSALQIVVYLIIIPLILIVAIGIGCTYRVVILKRITETSTFRALGLNRLGVSKLFFTEVLLILILGFLIGTSLSFVLGSIAGVFNFSFIPAFDLFLTGGKIVSCYSAFKILLVLLIISVTTLFSVFLTLRKITKISPATAFMATT
ncbi:MAG: FtsX-like permease family protein [Treponema sp.]|nr:FtsX-like permease family protein [Treponema sp.]